jgi:hypothetical protein
MFENSSLAEQVATSHEWQSSLELGGGGLRMLLLCLKHKEAFLSDLKASISSEMIICRSIVYKFYFKHSSIQ